jgi:hypothetical protein
MRCTPPRFARWITLLAILVHPWTGYGQAVSADDRFTLHGYLTQAYAQSSSLPVLGMTKTGRADFRLMVLQPRYAITDDDEFVTQLRHRHFGASPLALIEPEIAVSWAFYQRRILTPWGPVRVQVGRVPIAQGIYGETRFVGTLVPFFRAPISFYPEGIESVDGASVSYTTPSFSGWSVQGTTAVGSSRFTDVLQFPTGVAPIDLFIAQDYTGQLWVNTPLPGLRVGGSLHFLNEKSDTTARRQNRLSFVSVDGTFDRFFVRAEHNQGRLPSFGLDLTTHYAHGGVTIIGPLSVVYQYEFLRLNFNTAFGALVERNHDRAVGVVYAINPNVQMKIERHSADGYRFDQFVPATAPPRHTNYMMTSLSVSF